MCFDRKKVKSLVDLTIIHVVPWARLKPVSLVGIVAALSTEWGTLLFRGNSKSATIEIEIVYFYSHHMKLTGFDFRT